MILCQISDMHIKRPGERAYQRVDTAAYLRRAVTHLNQLWPRPDAVVMTGDLVDSGDPLEYAHLRALLGDLQIPYYLSAGNHDSRAALRAAFPEHTYLRQNAEFVQYAVDVGPLRLIALDTQDYPNPGGRLCERRLDWLSGQLGVAADRPVVITMHHPPFPTGIGHMDEIGMTSPDLERLRDIVQQYPNVERILCGHLHRPIHARFAGTIASTCPSPAHQVALDLRPDAPSVFMMEPPSYQLHWWQADTGLVTHAGFCDPYEGPYPFHDADGKLIP